MNDAIFKVCQAIEFETFHLDENQEVFLFSIAYEFLYAMTTSLVRTPLVSGCHCCALHSGDTVFFLINSFEDFNAVKSGAKSKWKAADNEEMSRNSRKVAEKCKRHSCACGH